MICIRGANIRLTTMQVADRAGMSSNSKGGGEGEIILRERKMAEQVWPLPNIGVEKLYGGGGGKVTAAM